MVSQKVVVVLLIVAIVFSIVSVALTLTLGNFRPADNQANVQQGPGGDTNGNLELSIEPWTGTPP